MTYPETILDLLNERILFCENFINSARNLSELDDTVSEFEKALLDFKYCKILYDSSHLPAGMVLFKKQAKKILANIYSAIEDAESHYVDISNDKKTGIISDDWQDKMVKTSSYLPQHVKDSYTKQKLFLQIMFADVDNM